MLSNPESLVCWHCGIHLKDILLPVGRTAQCPQCRKDLHVCRMCKHFDTRYTSDCSHQLADKVLEKDRVNLCSHFRVRYRAYNPDDDRVTRASREKLESLFGGGEVDEDQPATVSRIESSQAAKDEARRALEELFGNEGDS